MSIWEHTVDYKRYKLAIMWSGGMDGTIAYFYATKELGIDPEDIVMIHVDYGHEYEWKEVKAIRRVYELGLIESALYYVPAKIVNIAFGNVPTPDKQVVPGRNLMLAYIGSVFADRVWILALDGEMHREMPDKNHTFFSLASGVLSYVMDRDIIVETPFENMSKSDIAKWCVEKCGKELAQKILDMTVTCYDKDSWACGKCSTCFKRWVAYANAGLDWEHYFEFPPFRSDAAKKLIKNYVRAEMEGDYSHYSKKRIEETKRALKTVGLSFDDFISD